MAITRFAYASINVMDLDAAVHHYVHVVGLRLVERDTARAYLQAMDNQDHHCLVLNTSDSAGVDHVGFKVSSKSDLREAAQAAREWGLATHKVPAGELRGQGEGLIIVLPSEHRFLLFFHADKIGYETGMKNPDPVATATRPGARVTHLDHTLLATDRQTETARFLEEVLDFQLTEKVVDPAGNIIAAFLSCGNTMHDVAFGPGPNGHFHHMAFGVESRSDVIEGVDILKETATPALEFGITRHGVAGVTTIYFHDPSGNRNEFFNGAYPVAGVRGAVPPVVWPLAEFPRGGFYYESDIPEQFFAEVT